MQAVKITRRLDSETLHLPELRPFLGKEVEIIVLETETNGVGRDATSARDALRGSILRDDDPFGPAVPEDDWEVLR
jgi:hypothetical protein